MLEQSKNPLRILHRMADIVFLYFKDLKREVHKSAAVSLCDIFFYALPKDNQTVVMNYMFEPL